MPVASANLHDVPIPRMPRVLLSLSLSLSLAACTAPSDPPPVGPVLDAGSQPSPSRAAQDILTTDLSLDLSTRAGVATVRVLPAAGAGTVSLSVAGLSLHEVRIDGRIAEPVLERGSLVVPVDDPDEPVTLEARYTFPARALSTFDGWMPSHGVTMLWPLACHRLFPCDPSPADGVTFTMDVRGAPAGERAIHPGVPLVDAPPYLPAVAVGDYAELPLGRTEQGTEVLAFVLRGVVDESTARAGTAHLVGVMDHLERTYGPYPYGARTGAVAVDWGDGVHGGAEFHPYYHVPKDDFGDEEVHAHEAAHAWWGNAVRIRCWEDFVLAEGVTTYAAARALSAAGGPDLWPLYVDYLEAICAGDLPNLAVLPEGCSVIDLARDDLGTLATYMKGACFLEDVADLLGPDELDRALAAFHRSRRGQAVRMQELIDALELSAGAERAPRVRALADEWLRTRACPADFARRCRTRSR